MSWLIFAGPNQEWKVADPRVELIRDFPANDHLNRRIFADHFQVPAVARKRGASALLTVGFVPTRKCLPTVMHVLSLQTLDKRNRLGFMRQFYRNSMIKYNWPQADLVITNSQWTANQVLSFYPKFHDRMTISYEGLQHEIFHPDSTANEPHWIKEKFGVEPGYFLWISNFYPYKQAERLITGYARLDPETRRRHPLVMAGGNWLNGLEAAQAQAKLLGVEQDVKFLGWIDDESLAPLYRQAAAFCLASREETFGRCVIEAMACGTPCVVNDIPIMHEVTNGNALIVDFEHADVVADALRKLAIGGTQTAHLRDQGMARAREFTFEKLTTERMTAIRQLVSSRSSRRVSGTCPTAMKIRGGAAAAASKFVAELPVAITLDMVKIGFLQLNSTIGDFQANRQKLVAGYEKARALGAEFVIAPELFLCGYPPRDLLLRADFVDANLAALAETAKSIGPIPLCVGYVDENSERPGRALRNSAAVLQNGKIVWRTHKSLLPTYDVFDEDRYFEPAKSIAPFEFNGRKLGITICEDIWNDEDFWPERLYRRDPIKELIGQGAEIILNISASPWHDGKEKSRLAMLQRVARDERVPLAQVNLVGANDELIFDGHSVALDRRGEVIALGKGFAEEIFVADLEANSVPAGLRPHSVRRERSA